MSENVVFQNLCSGPMWVLGIVDLFPHETWIKLRWIRSIIYRSKSNIFTLCPWHDQLLLCPALPGWESARDAPKPPGPPAFLRTNVMESWHRNGGNSASNNWWFLTRMFLGDLPKNWVDKIQLDIVTRYSKLLPDIYFKTRFFTRLSYIKSWRDIQGKHNQITPPVGRFVQWMGTQEW